MYKIRNLKISGKNLVISILFYTIIMETLISQFHFPIFIRYVNDIILIFILLLNIKTKSVRNCKDMLYIKYIVALLFLICLLSSIISLTRPLLLIWGIRNTFRGIIYIFLVFKYLEMDDLKKIIDKFYYLQFVNLILALYQLIILHHSQDFIGGLFGYGNGAGVNIFNILMISYYLNAYLAKKESFFKLCVTLLCSLSIASIAEEKISFIFLLIILIISTIINKFNFKTIISLIIGIITLIIGLNILKSYYPEMYEKLVDFDSMVEYTQLTYEDGYALPRVGSFDIISKKIFNNDSGKILLGVGFGNAETSNISIFQSDFYKQYGYLNYRWFTSQWIFIETGYIGIISFVSIFIVLIVLNIKWLRQYRKNKYFFIASICNTVCLIIMIWYNSALKSDMSYLAYFSLSFGLLTYKENIKKKEQL